MKKILSLILCYLMVFSAVYIPDAQAGSAVISETKPDAATGVPLWEEQFEYPLVGWMNMEYDYDLGYNVPSGTINSRYNLFEMDSENLFESKKSMLIMGGKNLYYYDFPDWAKNSAVELWFYDNVEINNDNGYQPMVLTKIGDVSIFIKPEIYTNSDKYYTVKTGGDSGPIKAKVTRTQGWHQFVYDFSESGYVNVYIDRTLVAREVNETGAYELQMGSDNSSSVIGNWENGFFFDNLRIFDNTESLKANIDVSGDNSRTAPLFEENFDSFNGYPEITKNEAALTPAEILTATKDRITHSKFNAIKLIPGTTYSYNGADEINDKTIEIWFYDNTDINYSSLNETIKVGVSLPNSFAGVWDDGSSSSRSEYYTTYINGESAVASTVKRTTGWHQAIISYTPVPIEGDEDSFPDYYDTEVEFYIDGTLARKGILSDGYDQMMLPVKFGDFSTTETAKNIYFDDLRIWNSADDAVIGDIFETLAFEDGTSVSGAVQVGINNRSINAQLKYAADKTSTIHKNNVWAQDSQGNRIYARSVETTDNKNFVIELYENFKSQETYTLNIGGFNVTYFGKCLNGYTFKTENPLLIEDEALITLRDSSSTEEVETLYSDTSVYAQADAQSSNTFLAIAVYNPNKTLNDVKIVSGSNTLTTESVSIPGVGYTVKAFLWENDSYEPYNRYFGGSVKNPNITYYVAENGDDTNDGSSTAPFKTVSKAIKEARANTDSKTNARILIEDGTYYNANMTFNEINTNDQSITIKGVNGTPVLYGGEKVSDWESVDGNIYKTYIGRTATAVTENGNSSTSARYPNTGFLNAGTLTNSSNGSGFLYTDTLPEITDFENLGCFALSGDTNSQWFSDSGPVREIDTQNKIIYIKFNTYTTMTKNSRFYLEGSTDLIDQPGEFACKDGYLYYYPKNLPIESQEIVVSNEQPLVNLKGENGFVKNITFENIEFNTTGRNKEIFYLTNANNITVKDCILNNAGGSAVNMYDYAHNNTITGCEIKNMGAYGVIMSGSDAGMNNDTTRRYSAVHKNHNNTVTNNHIFNGGVHVAHSAGIQINDSGENYVAHNLIHGFPRYGISFKGAVSSKLKSLFGANYLDYAHNTNNVVEFNDIYNCNLLTHDTGVIESWGTINSNNIINNNSIHDSEIDSSFGYGIYLDDASNYYTVKNNLVYNLQQTNNNGTLLSVMMAKGVGNKMINNFFADNNTSTTISSLTMGGEPNKDLESENNIFYNSGNTVYNNSSSDSNRFKYSDKNTIYDEGSIKYYVNDISTVKYIYDWSAYLGHDVSSIIENPNFMAEGDYRLRYDSPSKKLGTKNIDIMSIGLKGDFKFARETEVADIILNNSEINLTSGTTAQINYKLKTATGFNTSGNVTFASDNTSVASVNSSGLVTANGYGKAKITLTVNGISKDIYIFVDDRITSVNINMSNATLLTGKTSHVTVYGTTELGQIILSEEEPVSSDTSVITVENGTVTAVAQGTTDLTASMTFNGSTIDTTKTCRVSDSLITIIEPTTPSKAMTIGTSSIMDVVVKFNDKTTKCVDTANPTEYQTVVSNTDGQKLNSFGIPVPVIEYKSLTPNIASIDSSGIITALSEGRATFLVTASYNGIAISNYYEITVMTSIRNPFEEINVNHIDSFIGVTVDYSDEVVTSCDSGDYICLGSFDFGDSNTLTGISMLSSSGMGGSYEIRIDSQSGPMIAKITNNLKGYGWSKFGRLDGTILQDDITGIHDIYITFTVTGTGNWKSFKFFKNGETDDTYGVN